MPLYHHLIIGYTVFINCFAYILMCYDKWQSKKKAHRISEKTLILVAFLLGALGVYLGTKGPLYHKAAKPKFKIGVPLLIGVNAACIYIIFKFL